MIMDIQYKVVHVFTRKSSSSRNLGKSEYNQIRSHRYSIGLDDCKAGMMSKFNLQRRSFWPLSLLDVEEQSKVPNLPTRKPGRQSLSLYMELQI